MLLFYFFKNFCEAVQLHVGIPLYLCKFEMQLENFSAKGKLVGKAVGRF